MSQYKVNPSSDVKQTTVANTDITATSTVINGGTAKNLGSDRSQLDNSGLGLRNQGLYGSKVVAGTDIGSAAYVATAAVALTSVADSGADDKALFTLVAHGLSVGNIINITGSTSGLMDGIHRVVSVPTADTFKTTRTYVAAATPGDYKLFTGNFAIMTAGKYIMRRVSTEVAGISNNVLRSGASGFLPRRSIHKLEHLYTNRVATAIRANYWDRYNGVWTTKPTSADDASTWGTDNAANPSYAIPGELVYQTGSTIPTQDDYPAKTN